MKGKKPVKKSNSQLFRVLFGRGIISKICFGIIVFFLILAIFAPIISPYSPTEQQLDNTLASPSKEHLLGTDFLGRDLLSRIVYGARISLVASLCSSLIAACLGTLLGISAGYFGGFWGNLIMRISDAQLSIPNMILAMVLVALFSNGVAGVVIIIGISMVPTYIRLMNGLVLSLKKNDFITAAALIGQPKFKTLTKHLVPNCVPTIIVLFTMNLGSAIMLEASMSYLGIGIVPPTPTWGGMVSEGYRYLTTAPLLALLPGICIILIVIAFNIFGDGLRDALDPRLRGKL